VEETQANVRSALANLRQGEQTVGSEVVQAYLDVRTADQKVKAAAAEVANAEEGLGLATGRYQAGVAAYIEVIDAETALITAQTNQVNAVYGLSIARAALARALGMEGY
jgi:outer membrane protein TolC